VGRLGRSVPWVSAWDRLQRHSIQGALAQAGQMISLDWATMAIGYFDQVHFMRDFKALVSRTPVEHAWLSRPR
jgi:hypothetical protein